MAATDAQVNRTGNQGKQSRARIKATLMMLDGSQHRVRLTEAQLPIECFCCGICCTCYQPLLDTEEIETIAQRLHLSVAAFLAKYAQRTAIGYLLRQTAKGCVFLAWGDNGARAGCRIYPFRPEVCRNWVPSLSRRECLEGIARLKARGRIMLVKELYPSPEARDRFHSLLADE